MIIDAHLHFFKDRAAGLILRKLSAASGYIPCTNGTLSGTCAFLGEQGVDKGVFLPIATAPGQQTQLNDYAAAVNGAEGCIISFGTVHPAAPDAQAELYRIKELGLAGVKLHPQYQEVAIDDARVEKLLRLAAALSLPVVFHAGDDPGLPPPLYAPVDAIARLLNRIEDTPGLVLIAAHMGGFKMWEQAERLLAGRNIWFDTACTGGLIEQDCYGRLIAKHGWRRIIFGSDCPWQSPAEARGYLQALGLPPEQEQAILGENCRKLLGLQ